MTPRLGPANKIMKKLKYEIACSTDVQHEAIVRGSILRGVGNAIISVYSMSLLEGP